MVYLIMTQTVPEILKDKLDEDAPYCDPIAHAGSMVLVDKPDFDNPNTLKLLFSTIRKLAEHDNVDDNNLDDVIDSDFPYNIDWCMPILWGRSHLNLPPQTFVAIPFYF